MYIRYEGTVRGFRDFALPALRKCAANGKTLQANSKEIQRELRKAMMKDLSLQIAKGGDQVDK